MEEEINLVDYARVFVKQKWLILSVIVVVVLFAAILPLFLQKFYVGYSALEIGRMYTLDKNGQPTIFVPETPKQIQEKVNEGLYNNSSAENVDPNSIIGVSASVENERSNIVRITVKTTNSEEGNKYLESLNKLLVSQNAENFVKIKDYLEKEISNEKSSNVALGNSGNLSNLQYLYTENLANIDKMEFLLNNIKEPTIIKTSAMVKSSKANFSINIITGLILGIIFGTIAAFIREFWQKNKKELLRK